MSHPITALVDLIYENAKEGMVIAEVGCWKGDTTKHYMGLVRKHHGHVYLVDWFSGGLGNHDPQHEHHYQPENAKWIMAELLGNIGPENVTVLQGDSGEMAASIPDHSLDICFIDADHLYQGVKKDIQNYLPKVKLGGILCGHDCGHLGSSDPCDVMKLANTFTPEQLSVEYVQLTPTTGCHPGVIQAVYEAFGNDVEIRPDSGYHGIPIWVKRI